VTFGLGNRCSVL